MGEIVPQVAVDTDNILWLRALKPDNAEVIHQEVEAFPDRMEVQLIEEGDALTAKINIVDAIASSMSSRMFRRQVDASDFIAHTLTLVDRFGEVYPYSVADPADRVLGVNGMSSGPPRIDIYNSAQGWLQGAPRANQSVTARASEVMQRAAGSAGDAVTPVVQLCQGQAFTLSRPTGRRKFERGYANWRTPKIVAPNGSSIDVLRANREVEITDHDNWLYSATAKLTEHSELARHDKMSIVLALGVLADAAAQKPTNHNMLDEVEWMPRTPLLVGLARGHQQIAYIP